MNDLKLEKTVLRQDVAAQTLLLDEQYINSSNTAILQYLLELPEICKAKTIFCFVSMDREVDTKAFIKELLSHGKNIGVPLCTGKGIMEVHRIADLSELKEGYRGILEPSVDAPMLNPAEIDCAIIPCVTCNEKGERLGHGGGYYDRYLEQANFPTICLCRQKITRDKIPLMAHDLPISILVTENGVFRANTDAKNA